MTDQAISIDILGIVCVLGFFCVQILGQFYLVKAYILLRYVICCVSIHFSCCYLIEKAETVKYAHFSFF